MLVLSRQKDESIVIGDDVEITIVDVRGDKVRLGINAPKEISVHRKEIYNAIQKEKQANGGVPKNGGNGKAKPAERHDYHRKPKENRSEHRSPKVEQQ